ncbi:hypothetical protein DXG03_000446 [Asterophora parasitica]|uniref:Uncharacterized protein n=1 Tax=Asterophora parasitica TaxID=117018 RepID=A0A9P7GC69_9AGAR|nr:hypothetical protein DXG03_000446 [Asterophora parasitica]
MYSPKGHAPIQDVLAAAGIDLPAPAPAPTPPPPPTTPLSTSVSRSRALMRPPLPSLSTLSLSLRTPQQQKQKHHPRRSNSTNTHHYSSRTSPKNHSSNHNPSHDNMHEFGAWRRRSVDSSDTRGSPSPPRIATEGVGARERRASIGSAHGYGYGMSQEEEMAWMAERMLSLERLRERKCERRGAFVGYFRGAGVEDTAFAARVVSENGHCSPVREEDTDVDDVDVDADVETEEEEKEEGGADVESAVGVDVDGVMVIGFASGDLDAELQEGDDGAHA